QVMHAVDRITHAHRTERVTVITTAHRKQARLSRPPDGTPVLQGHLDCDLDRDRTGVAEEDVFEALRRYVDESFRQNDGGFVRQAAEHDMGHAVELLPRRAVEYGMAIAVDRRPPRRHP